MTISDSDLEDLARRGEAERVEFKPSTKQKKEIREAICAFANDLPGHGRPGVVFVGLNNDGSPSGFAVTDGVLCELADLRSDGQILPLPTMSVERRALFGREVAVIIVEPSPNPPIRLRGRTMIRVGTRRGIATLEEEQRLVERARARLVPFELSAVPGASVNDLDWHVLERVLLPLMVDPAILEQNQRPMTSQMLALNLCVSGGVPTVLGILLAGRDPLYWVPGAYVQFVRIAGSRAMDPIRDQKEIHGPLPEVLAALNKTLVLAIEVEGTITTGGPEERRPTYPLPALQQAAWNAIMHRTYEGTHAPVMLRWFDNRVEIQNPGGPYGKVTKDNFGTPGLTDYRNPHLAAAMKALGYAQRFGFGIEIMRQSLAENGNPPPEFTALDSHVLVTIRRRP